MGSAEAVAQRATMRLGFLEKKRLSSWRIVSMNLWDKPRDPTVYGLIDVEMTRALEYLDALNSLRPDAKATVTHLVVKAIASAVAAYPEANAILAGRRRVFLRESVDVYCQVATDNGSDLTGVKIAHADQKSLADIAEELGTAVRSVHEKRDAASEQTKKTVLRVPRILLRPVLRLVEYLTYDRLLDLSRFGVAFDQFGSAMVSNVGGFGIVNGLAPLVPATRAPIVLLVGQIVERAIVRDGAVVAAPCMTIGCTFDHRVIDGYQAGRMAEIVRDTITHPARELGLPSRPSSSADRLSLRRPGTSGSDPNDSECTAPRSRSVPGGDSLV
jgi:hypothetical protein